MKQLYLIICAILFACNSGELPKTAEAEHTDTSATEKTDQPQTVDVDGCYQMTLKKDTASLTITSSNGLVSGSLKYHWFEKDHSDGTFSGRQVDSLLIVNYTFKSEGTTSVREVIFKMKAGQLIQGFGDLAQRGDTVVYAKPGSLQFDSVHPFIKISCDQE